MKCKEYGQCELLEWAEKLESSTQKATNKRRRNQILKKGFEILEILVTFSALALWIFDK